MKRKSTGISERQQVNSVFFHLHKLIEISTFQEFQTKFWEECTLTKTDPETFCFWVNDIFA